MLLSLIGGVGVVRELNVCGAKCVSSDLKLKSWPEEGLRVR